VWYGLAILVGSGFSSSRSQARRRQVGWIVEVGLWLAVLLVVAVRELETMTGGVAGDDSAGRWR
jgi:hypothetical protein